MKKIHPNIHSIFISLDASFETTYNQIRRGGNFKLVKKNIAFLVTQRKKNILKKIQLDFVVQDNNFHEMPDFVKLAEAYGAKGIRCSKPENVQQVLSEGLAHDGTVIMEFIVEKEESVYPMVPAGKAITEMLLV